MKFIFYLVILFTNSLIAQEKSIDLSIEIKESNAWCSNTYSFSKNGISIIRDSPMLGIYETYNNELFDFRTKDLLNLVEETDWDSVKTGFSNAHSDDNLEYDITITLNGREIKKHIYMTEYLEYMILVEELNKFIPDYFEIEYNYNYIHGKLKVLRGPMIIGR